MTIEDIDGEDADVVWFLKNGAENRRRYKLAVLQKWKPTPISGPIVDSRGGLLRIAVTGARRHRRWRVDRFGLALSTAAPALRAPTSSRLNGMDGSTRRFPASPGARYPQERPQPATQGTHADQPLPWPSTVADRSPFGSRCCRSCGLRVEF